MITVGKLHFVSAIVALIAGAWVLWRPKGTATHRGIGRVYAISMLVLNGTALLIYRLTGIFGPFHVAALISLVTLTAGIVPAIRRRPSDTWLEHHYFFMSYSYLGLVAAAIAETATRVLAERAFAGRPTMLFWIAVVLTAVAVFVVGGQVIKRRVAMTLRPFRKAPAAAPVAPPA